MRRAWNDGLTSSLDGTVLGGEEILKEIIEEYGD